MRLAIAIAFIAASSLASAYSGQIARSDGDDGGTEEKVPEEPRAETRRAVHVVHIDAIASDSRGQVIDHLTPSDFELREDGVAQVVESAQFNRPSPRLVAIFLDEYHVTPGASAARARQALTRFVDEELGVDDLVVVMKPLDSLFAIRPSLDREAARRAIAGFEGRKGDYAPRNAYETNYFAGGSARIETARLQVVVSAVNALAVALGHLGSGRKTVVIVAETLGVTAPSRGHEYLAGADTVIRSANRSNVSIYAVDPRATPAADAADASGREVVRTITAATNGDVIADADLGSAMRAIARDSRSYYLLTYRSAHNEDGRFHPVQVNVKRPGLEVRARAGYWAPSAEDALRGDLMARARQPLTPSRIEPTRRISPLIRPWFGLSRADGGRTRVTFVWDAPAGVPGDRTERHASRVILTARGADDAVIFEGLVLPTGPRAAEERAGRLARAVFDTPPGRLRLQMKIEDAASRVIDSDVRDLAIREWRSAVALGAPEVLRARNAREFRALDADPDAVPVASREFSRAERLLVRFQAYVPRGAEPLVSATLVGRSGRAMRELKVDARPMLDGRSQVDVPLAGLAPGEYAIELAATCRDGAARDRFEFRVTH